MKRSGIILLIGSGVLWCNCSFGQYSTDCKTGTNAILLNSSSFSLSVSDPKLSFDWTSLPAYVETKNFRFFGIAGVDAKNKSGIGNLFSKGYIVPESDLHGVFGFYLSNAISKTGNSERNFLNKEKSDIQIKLLDSYSTIIDAYRDTLTNDDITYLKNNLKKNKNDLNHFIDSFSIINADLYKVPAKTKILDRIKMEMEKSGKAILSHSDLDSFRRKYTDQRRGILSTDYYRITVFAFGNINASAFKHFEKLDTSNFAKSFRDVNFMGGSFGLGVNAEWKIFRIGITYSYELTNNFPTLKSTDYVVTSVFSNQNQKLSSEDKLTAYSGEYGEVEINELNLDLIINVALNKERSNYILINPYLHGTLFSRNTALLPNITSVGTGFYFFRKDSKFLGGLYIELPDVNNTMEKRKPVEKQNLRPANKRLTFGISAKMSINAIRFW